MLKLSAPFQITITRKNGQTAYKQFAAALRRRINEGELYDDQLLPDEHSWSTALGLNRITLRHGLSELQKEGLIYKIRGKGTFVRFRKPAADNIHHPVSAGQKTFILSSPIGPINGYNKVVEKGSADKLSGNGRSIVASGYTDHEDEIRHLTVFEGTIAGVIRQIPYTETRHDVEEFLKKRNIPCVQIFETDPPLGFSDSVCYFNEKGSYTGTRYFIERGIKNILFIPAYKYNNSLSPRCKGYVKAMQESGLRSIVFDPEKHDSMRTTKHYSAAEYGSGVVHVLHHQKKLPQVIFAENDIIAAGVFQAITDLGIKMPQQIEILGYGDDIELHEFFKARKFKCPLSTVRIPRRKIGIKAAELLLARLKNPVLPHQAVGLDTEMVHRETTKG